MPRYICSAFVALAICQAAFAIDLELTNQPSPTIDLFDGERATPALLGDMTTGEHLSGETIYTIERRSENHNNEVNNSLHVIQVPKGKRIHYVHAETTSGTTAVICGSKATLGSFAGFIYIRQPPNSQSVITFTIGAH